MSHWRLLDEEVARWRDLGRTAELWWRDDDAVDATPELDRLLQLHGASAVPLALAVVPARATAGLAERVVAEPGVDVLQHGYAHVNHALPPAKKIELGAERPAMLVLGELGTGWLALERICAGRALPVLVPPWNRIAPALVPALPEIGFKGLSTFGEVRRTEPVRGLRQVNTHVDVIDWKAGRGFVGEDAAIFSLVQALAAARAGTGGPVGVLSHHLAMDEPAWNFLMFLWARAKEMSGIQFRPARELFGTGEARA
jgi:peptidoglycan/xylan/chitin deacetylase (PgdA/CDA1 family)